MKASDENFPSGQENLFPASREWVVAQPGALTPCHSPFWGGSPRFWLMFSFWHPAELWLRGMLASGFPADAQGNVSLAGDVSLVLAELLGKAGGFLPLSSFGIYPSGAGEGDVSLSCSAQWVLLGVSDGLGAVSALLPHHTR